MSKGHSFIHAFMHLFIQQPVFGKPAMYKAFCSGWGEFREKWDDISHSRNSQFFSDPLLEYCEITPYIWSISVLIRNEVQVPTYSTMIWKDTNNRAKCALQQASFISFNNYSFVSPSPAAGKILFSQISIPGSPHPTFFIAFKIGSILLQKPGHWRVTEVTWKALKK